MQRKYFTRQTLIVILLALMPFGLMGQSEFTHFLYGGVRDANKIVNAYASPLMEGIGNNLACGWYNTADALKPGRFQLRFIGSVSLAPDSRQRFDMSEMDLEHTSWNEEAGPVFPTIFGKKSDNRMFFTWNSPVEEMKLVLSYKLPVPDTRMLPLVLPQLSVGVYKGTEVMLRFLPEMKIPGIRTEPIRTAFWGFGLKHNIDQWFGPIPFPFKLSVLGSYGKAGLNLKGPVLLPNEIIEGLPVSSAENYDEQLFDFESRVYTLSLLLSKKLPAFTFFAGLNYTNADTELSFKGAYPVPVFNDDSELVIEHLYDPVTVDAHLKQFSVSGGFRLKVAILSIGLQASYAPDGYSSLGASIGFGYFN